MKKVLLVLTLTAGTLISKAQSFTFNQAYISGSEINMSGELTMTDSSMTQTVNGVTATIPLTIIEGTNKMYKAKTGDWEARYTFTKMSEDMKIKDKRGRYIIKGHETATHILIQETVDRFTNNSMSSIMIYLTPKIK
jgi:hypothetical protein